jgi:choline dehydrogenase
VNAMNMALPPDSEWEMIASLTGDDTWLPESIRDIFVRLERNHYLPEGTPDYGFSGWLDVSLSLSLPALVHTLIRDAKRLDWAQ